MRKLMLHQKDPLDTLLANLPDGMLMFWWGFLNLARNGFLPL